MDSVGTKRLVVLLLVTSGIEGVSDPILNVISLELDRSEFDIVAAGFLLPCFVCGADDFDVADFLFIDWLFEADRVEG